MFMELGQVLDEKLYDLKQWFYGTWIYKLRMYIGLKKYIKDDAFKSNNHFDNIMIQVGYKGLYEEHFKKLIDLYYCEDIRKIEGLKREATKAWKRADERWGNDR